MKEEIRDKRKVLHILYSILPSGAETMLLNSADSWKSYDKHVLATASNVGEYSDFLQRKGYTIHHIFKKNPISQQIAVQRFIRENSFDVVHIHRESQSMYYALSARIAGAGSVVRTAHNVFEFKGFLKIKRTITRFIERRILKVKYVAISKSVYRNELKKFSNKSVMQINNWFDEKVYRFISDEEKRQQRRQMSISPDTFCIVSVANCNDVKNHQLIIKAIANIINSNDESLKQIKIKYFHIGSGPLENEEKQLAVSLGVENNIYFIGRYNNPIQYLSVSDLFVMPSIYEGVGISAMESMVTGMNVLLTNVPGLCDFHSIKSDNIYYSSLDIKDFTDAIKRVMYKFINGGLTNNFDQSKAILNEYSMKKSVCKYMDVYEM